MGCVRVLFSPSEPVSASFVSEGGQKSTSFEPDDFDEDRAYSIYFHQSILERRGDWVLLPKNPLPEPGWISLTTPEGELEVRAIRRGAIYTLKDESLVVIDTTENGLLVRPEQDCDMWCDFNPPPYEPFTPEERTFDQLRDADGHWLLEEKYKKGC